MKDTKIFRSVVVAGLKKVATTPRTVKIRVLPVFGETERVEEWTMEDVLAKINEDRSSQWTDYTEEDWKEGWDEWIEGEFYSRKIPK